MPYVSAVCGLGALYLIVEVAFRIQRRVAWVEVDHAGLRWSCRGKSFQKSWSDVKSLHREERLENGVALGNVKLQFRDGDDLGFNRMLSNYDEVATGIQSLATVALRDSKERDLAAGKAEFGPVTLRQAALGYQGREHPWSQVDYAVMRGNLVSVPAGKEIHPSNVTTQILLSEIPNYAVLLELMARHGKPPCIV